MDNIKIFLADDHQILRQSLRMLLNKEPDMEVVGEGEDGLTIEDQVKVLTPDILLLDISMPRKNGLQVMRELSPQLPNLGIVVLTMHKNADMISEAFQSGAKGYILKENAFEELVRAIRDVHQGKIYISKELSPMLLEGFLQNEKQNRDLSDRELEVLKLLAEGYSNKEISDLLTISIKTVETHRANIMRKHNFKNITELVLYAVRNKIIEV